MRSLISTGTVTAGQTYFITDVGMAGIQVQGIDANSITSQGQYIGYFPDYQNESGDFAGLWNLTLPSCTVGKLYAWNGAMFQSVDGSTGTDPSSAPTSEWLLIDKTDPRYQKEILTVQYDVVSNTISKGEDARGNIITGSSGFATFKWGCDTANNNTMNNTTGDFYNVAGLITGNSFVSCQFYEASFMGYISGCSFVSTRVIPQIAADAFINLLNCFGNAELVLTNDSTTIDLVLTGCQFSTAGGGSIIAILCNGGSASNCQFIANLNGPSTLTVGLSSYALTNSYIGLTLSLSASVSGLFVTNTVSNHESTVDLDLYMTGNTLDFIAAPVALCQGVGIWNVTSAATKTIDKIVFTTNLDRRYPITIRPVNGKSVVIDTTAIGSAVTDNIVSSGTNETLVGRTNGGDFYTIQRSGTMWQKINSSVNV
jgi:hypothetical protein